MELPENLKTLYQHWPFHVGVPISSEPIAADQALLKKVQWFIGERIAMWKRKIMGKEPPYSEDPILAKYRFCNIFREFDRQTITFHTLLNLLRNDFPLWLLNMFYCRMVARPETVRSAGLLSFDEKENQKVYERLINLPRPRFGNAYVFPISVIQKSKTPTRELFITRHLPEAMPKAAEEILKWNKGSVYEGVKAILPIFGFNLSFLWTEALIDTAYQFPRHLDLFSRFPVGPGALPTLQKIDPKKDPSILVQELSSTKLDTGITYEGRPLRLSSENWEGIGCEFRKYVNLSAGRGRRRFYHQK